MLRFHPSRFGWVLAFMLGFWAVAVQAQEFHYRYVSLDQLELPPEFTSFGPAAIDNSGRVYGTVWDDSFSDPHIAFYKDGTVTVLQSSGFAITVNAGGTVGGFVLVDPQNFIGQAALFRGDEVELIPPQPGEVFSLVIALSDRGTALVESDDASGQPTYVLYSKGQTTPLDFGPTVTNPSFRSSSGRFINNEGILAGLEGSEPFVDGRGFRFDPRTGEVMLLDPVSPDKLAWGVGINNRGDVLGWSFDLGPPYHERVGVWDRNGDFKTYFDWPPHSGGSNALLFNDSNLIVITATSGNKSYLVPKPGVRLNLADLVENLPAGQDLRFIIDMNNHGNMIGSSYPHNFLLERVGGGTQ